MRTRTTRFEVAVVAIFLIVAAVLLVFFLPAFFGAH
jgi:ABC-type transporter Mla subunit MlaD